MAGVCPSDHEQSIMQYGQRPTVSAFKEVRDEVCLMCVVERCDRELELL